MLGCSQEGIVPEEVLQTRTSQLARGVSPLNVSLGLRYWTRRRGASKPKYQLIVDDGVRLCRRLLGKIPVSSDA
jgi:hypothetical protein